jgi:ribonucleoside-diphosphate reductase alpha chain
MPIELVIKLVSSLQLDSQSINTWKNGVERALKRYIQDGTVAGEKCPKCKSQLIFEEGCLHCPQCGYSKCG